MKIKDIIDNHDTPVIFKVTGFREYERMYKKLYNEGFIKGEGLNDYELPDTYKQIIFAYNNVNFKIINDELLKKYNNESSVVQQIHSMNEFGEFETQEITITNDVRQIEYITDDTKIPLWSKSVVTNNWVVYNTSSILSNTLINYMYK